MALNYERLHWGDRPLASFDATVLVRVRATPIDEISALSYAASKGGHPAVFRHAFERRRDAAESRQRGPYLLEEASRGEFRLGDVPARSLAIGLGVDLETRAGDRVLLAESFIVTDTAGRCCQIAFRDRVPVNLEQWGARVTAEGIEG